MSEAPVAEAAKATSVQFLALIARLALSRYAMLLWIPVAVFALVGSSPYGAFSAIDSPLGALLEFLGSMLGFTDLAALGSLHGTAPAVGAKVGFLALMAVFLAGFCLDLARYVRSTSNRPPFRSKKKIERIAALAVAFCVVGYWYYREAIDDRNISVDVTLDNVVPVFLIVAMKAFTFGAFVFYGSREFYHLLPRRSASVSRP